MIKKGPNQDNKNRQNKAYTPFRYRLSGRTILFVGGGNLSFELSYARKHPRLAFQMVATTYESLEDFCTNPEAVNNRSELEKRGAIVFHKIDATLLHSLDIFKGMNPEHIYYCHPYVNKNKTKILLRDFFYSVSCLHAKDCKIHIIRVRGGDYEMSKPEKEREFYKSWRGFDLIEHYKKLYGFYEIDFSDFILRAKHRFNDHRYHGYKHVQTNNNRNSALIIGADNSLEYVFSQRNSQDNDLSDSGYFSQNILSDTESETEDVLPKRWPKNTTDDDRITKKQKIK